MIVKIRGITVYIQGIRPCFVPKGAFFMIHPRLFLLLAVFVATAAVAFGCGQPNDAGAAEEGKLSAVTSFYTLYDFARKIGGEHANVTNLIPSGVEPHDWTPKIRDMTRMSQADLLIYNGAGFEGWIGDVLDSLPDRARRVTLEASDGIDLIRTGTGRQTVDPHTWVSPRSAIVMARNIRDGFVKADPANRSDYEANFQKLAGRLEQLDEEYKQALAPANLTAQEIVVTHRSFGYLCRDYGLEQISMMGYSPDAEPTAQDLRKISAFIKQHQVKAVFYEELVSDRLAKMLANDLNVELLVLNPLEGLTTEEADSGQDYVSVMQSNLQSLLKALQ